MQGQCARHQKVNCIRLKEFIHWQTRNIAIIWCLLYGKAKVIISWQEEEFVTTTDSTTSATQSVSDKHQVLSQSSALASSGLWQQLKKCINNISINAEW